MEKKISKIDIDSKLKERIDDLHKTNYNHVYKQSLYDLVVQTGLEQLEK